MQPWTAKQKLLPKDEEWVRDSDLLPPKLSWRSRLFLKVERWSWGELSPQAVQALAARLSRTSRLVEQRPRRT